MYDPKNTAEQPSQIKREGTAENTEFRVGSHLEQTIVAPLAYITLPSDPIVGRFVGVAFNKIGSIMAEHSKPGTTDTQFQIERFGFEPIQRTKTEIIGAWIFRRTREVPYTDFVFKKKHDVIGSKTPKVVVTAPNKTVTELFYGVDSRMQPIDDIVYRVTREGKDLFHALVSINESKQLQKITVGGITLENKKGEWHIIKAGQTLGLITSNGPTENVHEILNAAIVQIDSDK